MGDDCAVFRLRLLIWYKHGRISFFINECFSEVDFH